MSNDGSEMFLKEKSLRFWLEAAVFLAWNYKGKSIKKLATKLCCFFGATPPFKVSLIVGLISDYSPVQFMENVAVLFTESTEQTVEIQTEFYFIFSHFSLSLFVLKELRELLINKQAQLLMVLRIA